MADKRVVMLRIDPQRVNEWTSRLQGQHHHQDAGRLSRQELTERALAHISTAISLMLLTDAVDASAEVKCMADMVMKHAKARIEPLPGTGSPS